MKAPYQIKNLNQKPDSFISRRDRIPVIEGMSLIVDTFEKACILLEGQVFKKAFERLEYVFAYFPELANYTHEEIGFATGLNRETITRIINLFPERTVSRGRRKRV